MIDYYPPLEPEKFYHLFIHSNGNELLFQNEDDYDFFLEKFIHFVHFHKCSNGTI
jgi:hypothetical protein